LLTIFGNCERFKTSKGTTPGEKTKKENLKMKNQITICEVGDKVKGTYYGQEYTGVVDHARFHTINDSFMHSVALDQPIEVFSMSRRGIIISSDTENTIEKIAA
jgi:hypothetical protein